MNPTTKKVVLKIVMVGLFVLGSAAVAVLIHLALVGFEQRLLLGGE